MHSPAVKRDFVDRRHTKGVPFSWKMEHSQLTIFSINSLAVDFISTLPLECGGVVYCQVARKSSCPKMIYSYVAQNFIMLNNIVTSLVHIYRVFFAPTRVNLQTMMKSIMCIWFLYCKHTQLRLNLHVLFIASQSGDKPFAAWHSRGTKLPCWDTKVALGQDQQKAYIILNGNFLCLSYPSVTFASQHGGFVPREWQAAYWQALWKGKST